MVSVQAPVVAGSIALPASYSTDKEFFATRYKQGGRTVYLVALTPAQLASIVKRPDTNIASPTNRLIKLQHAKDFAGYVSAVPRWISPGVILRAPSIFSFEQVAEIPDAQFGLLKYPERREGDIHILDGQHRILGFHIALESIDAAQDRARSDKATATRVQDKNAVKGAQAEIDRLEKVRDMLYTERVAVEFQVTDDMRETRQAFADIAENALGITASVKARFDTTKVENRVLEQVIDTHPLLKGRVEKEFDRVPRRSVNLYSARAIADMIRALAVGYDGRMSRRAQRETSEGGLTQTANEFFDVVLDTFPQMRAVENGQIDAEKLRQTSMLGAPIVMRILAGVYFELRAKHGFTVAMVKEYFTALGKHFNAPAHEQSIWILHGPQDSFTLDSWAPRGRRQEAKALVLAIVDWAILQEQFVKDEPAPAPEVEVDPDEGIDFAGKVDLTQMAVEMRNEMEAIAATSKEKVAPRVKRR